MTMIYVSDDGIFPINSDGYETLLEFVENKYTDIVECNWANVRGDLHSSSGMYFDKLTKTVYRKTVSFTIENDKVNIHITSRKIGEFKDLSKQVTEDIKENPRHLKFVADPPEELCWNYIRQLDSNIRYIRKPTIEMCKYVLGISPRNINYIDNQTEELCLIVASHGTIEGIRDPSINVCLAAIEKCPTYSLCYIIQRLQKLNKLTDELCRTIISKHYYCIEYITNSPEHIQRYAIDVNVDAYFHIKNPSSEILDYATAKYMENMAKQ